jgi:hypothetical protein
VKCTKLHKAINRRIAERSISKNFGDPKSSPVVISGSVQSALELALKTVLILGKFFFGQPNFLSPKNKMGRPHKAGDDGLR